MENQVRVGVGVIIKKAGKVLVGKRKNSHGSDTWGFAGGHLEFGESWEDCARREVKEETGLEITNLNFGFATNDIFSDELKHYITIFMIADCEWGDAQLLEPDKCEAWQWFAWDKLPVNLFLPIQNLRKTNFIP